MRIPLNAEHDLVEKKLKVPPTYMIPVFIGIGYANPDEQILEQYRPDIEKQIHLGGWKWEIALKQKNPRNAGFFAVWKSVVTAAAASSEERAERAVFAHTVRKSRKDRPAASRKDARREHARARSQNEQDNENPKIAVIAQPAIHSFLRRRRVYVSFFACGLY